MAYQLDKQQERDAREALRLVGEAEEICRQGAAAGYDMQAQEIQCSYYRQRLQAVLDQFGKRRVE